MTRQSGPWPVPATLLLLLGLLAPAAPSYAAPAPDRPPTERVAVDAAAAAGAATAAPSERELSDSRAETRARAKAVAQIEAELIAADARSDQLGEEASTAVEAYNGARFRLEQASVAAAEARRRATGAQAEFDAAHRDVGRLAAAAYRLGSSVSDLAPFLAGGGPREVVDQSANIDMLGDQRRRSYDRSLVADVAADILSRRAQQALTAQRQAAAAVAAAKRLAEQQLQEQRRMVAGLQRRRGELLVLLAQARQTSVRLEQERLAAIGSAKARAETELQRSVAVLRNGLVPGASDKAAAADRFDLPTGVTATEAARRAIDYARAQLGRPYEWAAAGPDTFDCSGLTMRAWAKAGVTLPHYSVAQYQQSWKVRLDEMIPGDLVFFGRDRNDPTSIYHVALYVGDGLMIEAPYTGSWVRVSSIFRASLFGAARPVR